ncbi:MAG: hypothetical protein FJY98_03990 [Candidatus Liptonbacteria bacterium]|nr:hypothetical protein [Candidatus Liptonbacteria bacterium]
MSNKTALVIAIVGIVIVAVVGIAAVMLKTSGTPEAKPGTPVSAPTSSGTRQAAPVNVVVPEVGAKNAPANVAVPQISTEVARDAAAAGNFRVFDMKVEGDAFVPNTVIVNQGDSVRVNITATDKDYEFTQPELGYNFPLVKGKKMPLAFTATSASDFLFYCGSCGGPQKGPKGHIIVAPKK